MVHWCRDDPGRQSVWQMQAGCRQLGCSPRVFCSPPFLPSVSVALPEWFFSKDKQTPPRILLVLLFGGIVTPLGVAAWYLMGTQK